MVKKMLGWVRTQFEPKPDPQLEQLVRWYADRMCELLSAQREQFNFEAAMRQLEADPRLAEFISDRAYRSLLRRAWTDGEISAGEQRTLGWAASKLGIPFDRAREIDQYVAGTLFSRMLTAALSDGELSDQEITKLSGVAAGVGETLPHFSRHNLTQHGRALVDRLVLQRTSDTAIDPGQWQSFLRIGARLGFSPEEFLATLRPASRQLLDDVLDRIASDSVVDEAEVALVNDLIAKLGLGPEARDAVVQATAKLTKLREFQTDDIQALAHELNQCGPREVVRVRGSSCAPQVSSFISEGRHCKWWEVAKSEAAIAKYNAGASSNVDRRNLRVIDGPPRALQMEGPAFGLAGTFGSIHFLPLGVLFRESCSRYAGLAYGGLEAGRTRFVEYPPPPGEATIVDHTWVFVNKSGGPDQRFKDNRQLPVCQYAALWHPQHAFKLYASNERIADLLPRH